MRAAFIAVALLALAGCVNVPDAPPTAPACAAGEASYACQVQRYHDVSAP
jgi:hypothetical protein